MHDALNAPVLASGPKVQCGVTNANRALRLYPNKAKAVGCHFMLWSQWTHSVEKAQVYQWYLVDCAARSLVVVAIIVDIIIQCGSLEVRIGLCLCKLTIVT